MTLLARLILSLLWLAMALMMLAVAVPFLMVEWLWTLVHPMKGQTQ